MKSLELHIFKTFETNTILFHIAFSWAFLILRPALSGETTYTGNYISSLTD